MGSVWEWVMVRVTMPIALWVWLGSEAGAQVITHIVIFESRF